MADKTTPGGVLYDPVTGQRLDEPSAVNLDARLREVGASIDGAVTSAAESVVADALAAADRAEAAAGEAAGAVPRMAVAASRLGLGEAPETGLWAVGLTWRGARVDLSSLGEVGPLRMEADALREDVDALAASSLTLGLGEAPEPGLWAVGVTWRGARVGGSDTATPSAPAGRTVSGPAIACFGDSLTYLPGMSGATRDVPSTSYPAVLGATLGVPVTNRGWSARTASQIAMHNGATAFALSAPVTIPAATEPVTITTTMAYPDVTYTRAVTLAGVRGTLRRTSSGVTFTRAVAGDAVQAPAQSPIVVDWDTPSGATCIVGIGRNSVGTASEPPSESLPVVLSRVQDFVQAATADADVPRLLILDVPPYHNQGTGTWNRPPLDALNSALAQTWPQYHITPYAYLRTPAAFEDAGLTPTAQDEADMAADITPATFRGDTVHLTTEGNKAVARYIAAALRERRWYV